MTPREGLLNLGTRNERKRRLHSKVKTGCITCKIRRKKCDETKPSCVRCTSTGRKCDGYAPITPPSSEGSSSAGRDPCSSNLTTGLTNRRLGRDGRVCSTDASPFYIHRHLSQHTFSADVDGHCFDYFRFCTGPQFESYFDSSIWRTFVAQTATTHPVILKAAAATGAAHRRFECGISREAFAYCEISDRLYREAVKSLAEFRREEGRFSQDISMVAGVVLGLYEAFQGNYDTAVNHTTTALKHILGRPMQIIHSESQYRNVHADPSLFRKLFHKLSVRATQLFGTSPNILCRHKDGKNLPPIPPRFTDLEQARDLLFTEVEWILHAPARLWVDSRERHKVQHVHVSRLLQWSVTYAETIRALPARSSRQKRGCMLLKLTRSATYLLLYLALFLQTDAQTSNNLSVHRDQLDSSVVRPSSSISQPCSMSASNKSFTDDLHDIESLFDVYTSYDHLSAHNTGTIEEGHTTTPEIKTRGGDANGSIRETNSDRGKGEEEEDEPSLATSLLSWPISYREELNTNLVRMCVLADTFLDEKSAFAYDQHSISFDSGIGPPRRPQPDPGGSAKTKHVLRSMLWQKPKPFRDRSRSQSVGRRLESSGVRGRKSEITEVDSLRVHGSVHPPGGHLQHESSVLPDDLTLQRPALCTHALVAGADANQEDEQEEEEKGDEDADLHESLGVYSIAERLSAIEEHAIIAAIKSVIPVSIDPKWVDCTCFLNERRVLLRFCREAEIGQDVVSSWSDVVSGGRRGGGGGGGGGGYGPGLSGGLIWTQQWLAF